MQLVYEINNKKYLLFEVPIVSSASQKKIIELVKKCNGIAQGLKDIKVGFWRTTAIVNVLIPEESIETFNNADI